MSIDALFKIAIACFAVSALGALGILVAITLAIFGLLR